MEGKDGMGFKTVLWSMFSMFIFIINVFEAETSNPMHANDFDKASSP